MSIPKFDPNAPVTMTLAQAHNWQARALNAEAALASAEARIAKALEYADLIEGRIPDVPHRIRAALREGTDHE